MQCFTKLHWEGFFAVPDCVKTAFTVRLSLTANAVVTLKIEYLSVRPEQRRRAPREFPRSLPLRMTLVGIVILNEVKDLV